MITVAGRLAYSLPSMTHAAKKHCICRVGVTPRIMVRYAGSVSGYPYWWCPKCKRLEMEGGVAPNLLLLGVVGSNAYGLATKNSDKDYLGVYQEPTRNLVGLTPLPETFVSHEPDDRTLHEVGKFMRLALAGNPTVNEFLWLDGYEKRTEGGNLLLSIRESFLSNKMRKTYGGYARQQAERLARGKVESNQKKRIEKHGRHCFRLMLQGRAAVETGKIRVCLNADERVLVFEMGRLAASKPALFQEKVDEAMAEFDATPSVLPDQPDAAKAETVLLELRADGSL